MSYIFHKFKCECVNYLLVNDRATTAVSVVQHFV